MRDDDYREVLLLALRHRREDEWTVWETVVIVVSILAVVALVAGLCVMTR